MEYLQTASGLTADAVEGMQRDISGLLQKLMHKTRHKVTHHHTGSSVNKELSCLPAAAFCFQLNR